ncbi:MAG: T9SS type A sorting domain-containing protein [Crocinitomicaceae bacterium]|nr:T9SS type A sorting domain-containing protein [Crocinitomicaceae bacterium]
MKAFFIALISALFIVLPSFAQNYSFAPGDQYYGSLPLEQYSVHQVNIQNMYSEDALITWRLIENTCPEEWEFILCDWPHCYDGMPTTGNMNPVAPGEYGFVKLTVNPYDVQGSGFLHFYIFPTGFNDNHVDLIFHFSTEGLAVAEKVSDNTLIYPQPASHYMTISGMTTNFFEITDITGSKVFTSNISAGRDILLDISHWPTGIYFLKTQDSRSRRFIISHE